MYSSVIIINQDQPDQPLDVFPKERGGSLSFRDRNGRPGRSAWHADGPNPLLRPDSSSRSESKGLDVSQPPWTSHSSQG